MFSSTINEFLDRERSKRVFRAASRQKKHKVGESRQCFAGDEFHLGWGGTIKEYMRNTSANFFGISCQFIFERGERRLIQAGFWKWNFKKAVKRSKVHAPAFTCFSCPCEFVLQHLCYWAQNSKESRYVPFSTYSLSILVSSEPLQGL